MAVYAGRHGQDQDNAGKDGDQILNGRRNLNLTPLGKRQADEMAEELRNLLRGQGRRIKIILSSPLQRALDSAAPVAKIFGAKIVIIDRLIERRCGVCTGARYSKLPLLATDWIPWGDHVYVIKAPGYEGDSRLVKRAAYILETAKEHTNLLRPEEDVFLSTHGGVLKALEAVQKGLSIEEMRQLKSIKNGKFIKLVD